MELNFSLRVGVSPGLLVIFDNQGCWDVGENGIDG